MPAFERADAAFAARAPGERRASQARAPFLRLAWEHDVPGSARLRGKLIRP